MKYITISKIMSIMHRNVHGQMEREKGVNDWNIETRNVQSLSTFTNKLSHVYGNVLYIFRMIEKFSKI